MKVQIWSDIACPWCYVGKRRFDSALAQFPHRDQIQIIWRSFELNPNYPADKSEPVLDWLVEHKKISPTYAKSLFTHVTETGALDGIRFNFEKAIHGSTFQAHRLVHFAQEHSLGHAMKERLFAAYFEKGESISSVSSLVELGKQVGLDADKVRACLESATDSADPYSNGVREDEANAKKLGVSGVPFFLIDGQYQLSGAQSVETILGILNKAWDGRKKSSTSSSPTPSS